MNQPTQKEFYIVRSFQLASSSHIFHSLRLVSIDWTSQNVSLYFYVDGELSKDDRESINLIDTYFGTNFSRKEIGPSDFKVIRVDSPTPIDSYLGECVFARKENPPIGKVRLGVLTEKCLERREKILLALQRAMINHIFLQLRTVYIDWSQTSATLYFCVDGEISGDDRTSADLIHAFFCMQFPKEEMERCKATVLRIDFPERIAEDYGTIVYDRKEMPELLG